MWHETQACLHMHWDRMWYGVWWQGMLGAITGLEGTAQPRAHIACAALTLPGLHAGWGALGRMCSLEEWTVTRCSPDGPGREGKHRHIYKARIYSSGLFWSLTLCWETAYQSSKSLASVTPSWTWGLLFLKKTEEFEKRVNSVIQIPGQHVSDIEIWIFSLSLVSPVAQLKVPTETTFEPQPKPLLGNSSYGVTQGLWCRTPASTFLRDWWWWMPLRKAYSFIKLVLKS